MQSLKDYLRTLFDGLHCSGARGDALSYSLVATARMFHEYPYSLLCIIICIIIVNRESAAYLLLDDDAPLTLPGFPGQERSCTNQDATNIQPGHIIIITMKTWPDMTN